MGGQGEGRRRPYTHGNSSGGDDLPSYIAETIRRVAVDFADDESATVSETSTGEREENDSISLSREAYLVTQHRHACNAITHISAGFCEMMGYSRDELLGRDCRMLQGPLTDPHQIQKIRDSLDKETDVKVTLVNYRKDGRPVAFKLALAPAKDHTGVLTHYVGLHREVNLPLKSRSSWRIAQSPPASDGTDEENLAKRQSC